MKVKEPTRYPFHKGKLLHYVSRWDSLADGYEEKTAAEARTEVLCFNYEGFQGGRSSVLMFFKDLDSGLRYHFFWSSFDEIIKRMDKGQFAATVEPVKKGSNYAWRIVK